MTRVTRQAMTTIDKYEKRQILILWFASVLLLQRSSWGTMIQSERHRILKQSYGKKKRQNSG